MQQVIIAKYVNEPKNPAGKFGNITDADKNRYFMPKGMLGLVKPGVPFAADIEEQKWGDGDPVQVITKVLAQPSQQATARAGATNSHAQQDQGESIFITGVVGRALGSGQFSIEQVKILTLAAYEAWQAMQARKRGNISAQPEDRYPPNGHNASQDLNDEIPW